MNTRGWTLTNEDQELDAYTEGRLNHLSRRWSELHNEAEKRMFARQSDIDEGRDCDLPECDRCSGSGYLGIDIFVNRRLPYCSECGDRPAGVSLFGIVCPDCNGDGIDHSYERREVARQAERDAEIEIVEAMLAQLGARMMRPYEHWNEDERLMEYLERER